MARRIARPGAVTRPGPTVGLVPVVSVGLGVLWWWAVVRLAVAPDAGVVEGALAAGGWGLSLLPVHCVAKARAAGALGEGRWRAAWQGREAGCERE